LVAEGIESVRGGRTDTVGESETVYGIRVTGSLLVFHFYALSLRVSQEIRHAMP
jgi:hypothetical protein